MSSILHWTKEIETELIAFINILVESVLVVSLKLLLSLSIVLEAIKIITDDSKLF